MRHGITSRIDSPVSAARLLIVWFLLPSFMTDLCANDGPPIPSWQQGISKWNGHGYDLPTKIQPATAPTVSATTPNSVPYTVPIDPTSRERQNPYFALPKTDNIAPLELTRPSAIASSASRPNGIAAFALPDVGSNSDLNAAKNDPDSNRETTGQSIQELPPPTDEPAEKQPAIPDPSAAPSVGSISDKLATAEGAAEPAPLETEVIRWYQYPRKWIRGWDSHAELGLDASNGNADTLAFQTGLELMRKTDLHTLAIDIDYRYASSRKITTEDNGRFNIDYDRLLMDSDWSAFGKFGMEWDEFKAFDLRVNVNSGVGYHWIRQDDAALVTRFGAGASKEIGSPDDDWIAEAVFGIKAHRQLTSRQKLIAKVDYFPAWENFGDYRLVSDIAWEILLDGSENLSLKLAATDRYDSTPQGAKPNDVYYSLLLLYKF